MARPLLRRLAAQLGILPGFVGADGVRHDTSDASRVALLGALGIDATSEADAAAALAECRPAGHGVRRAGPATAYPPPQRCLGLWLNLYSVRGGEDLGCGTLTDLRALAERAGALGVDFLGLNPLHATRNRGAEVSPYSGLSRLFHNPIYLDPGAIPEARDVPWPRYHGPTGERIDYAAVAAHRAAALDTLLPTFESGRGGGEEFRRFVSRDDRLVVDFATFCALDEAHACRDWRGWPEPLRDPRSTAVTEFREAHRLAVQRHLFAQFELERQLGACAATARGAGMRVGLYQDLALGSLASGFDAWRFPDLVVRGATLGAPPDAFCVEGQDWGIPPLAPRALADSGHFFTKAVFAAAMRHGGALRIDHAMGWQRQFWIPRGASPAAGAYVRYPLDDLLALAAQQSRDAGVVVIGEDLGTVPRGFSRRLQDHGMLSSRVLLFERTPSGGFRAASRYPPQALVTANTHDHPTLAAWAAGDDLALRAGLGVPTGETPAARQEAVAALWRRLARDGVLGRDAGRDAGRGAASDAELTAAVYRFLLRTPSAMVGVALDDLALERTPVNLPGVGQDRYPSWTRRMRAPAVATLAEGWVGALLRAGRG